MTWIFFILNYENPDVTESNSNQFGPTLYNTRRIYIYMQH
jgi:hypothetical protein